MSLLAQQKPTGGGTTTIIEGLAGGGGGTITTQASISVNNQLGETAYTTQQGDNLALILLSDASAISVSLTTQTPPWSCFIVNKGALGDGTITVTPATGTINGAATLTVLPTYWVVVALDGTNWYAATLPIVPETFTAVTNEFLVSYDAATGLFSSAQPSFGNLSGQIDTSTQMPNSGATAGSYTNANLTVNAEGLVTAVSSALSGTTGSLGGAPMTAGETITTAVTITGASVGMVAVCNPQTYPGDSFCWDAYVSSADTATVRLTAVLAGTPVASLYSVRLLN